MTRMDDHARKVAAWISLGVGITLFIIKFYAYRLTGSQAILSDALEGIVNIISAIISLSVVAISSKPADRDHPYGHGKAEFFAAGFEGGAILFAGVLILLDSVRSWYDGNLLRELDFGLVLIGGAGIANGLLGYYLKKVGKRQQSAALEASGKHVWSDFITSLGVIIGLLIVKLTGVVWLDSLVAFLVGGHLALTGFRLFVKSGSELMDTQDMGLIERLGEIFGRVVFPGMIRIHHTRVMRSGRYHHVDLHLVVPEFWSVERAHDESNRFEEEVMSEYPMEGELHFHLDPCRKAYCEVCDLESCTIRQKPFRKRIPFSFEELTSPDEPEEMRVDGPRG